MRSENDPRPVYQRLADKLAMEIARGVFQPGQALPAISQLQIEMGVSNATVFRVLEVLAARGVIDRQQGKGVFVRRPDFTSTVVRSLRYYGSAADRRSPQSRIVGRESIVGPSDVTEALQLPDRTPVIRLTRLRTNRKRPVLVEVIWLEESRFSAILAMKDEKPPLMYPLYERLCGVVVASTRETLSVESAGDLDAHWLQVALGSPVIALHRVAFGFDDKPVEWRRSRGAATDFQCELEIR